VTVALHGARGLHPWRNTASKSSVFERCDLDKLPISQHAAGVLMRQPDSGGAAGRGTRAMRLVTGLLAGLLLLAGLTASHAVVRIANDRGGRIGTYVDKYQNIRTSGDTVVIDGLCASACTIVLGAVPHDRICVTSRASFGFHAAWDPGAGGRRVTNAEATRMLYSMYPTSIRRWIARHGGLKPQMIFLRGHQLTAMYKPCYMDAHASAAAR
jgi:hypothetical protein